MYIKILTALLIIGGVSLFVYLAERKVAKAVVVAVVLAVLIWFNEFYPPQNSVAVSSVKIDHFNNTMTFEYNGEKWFVRFPEHKMPEGHTEIRVEFKDGEPAYIWVHTWYCNPATNIKWYDMVWLKIPVLEAKKSAEKSS